MRGGPRFICMCVVSVRPLYVDNSGNLLSAAPREKNPDISVL